MTPDGEPRDGGPLLTGSSSTYHSLRCGLALADHFDEPQPEWEIAAGRLGHLIAEHPEVFLDKDRFSMDWYYPVLGGAVRGEAGARAAACRGGTTSSSPGLGIRCVDDEPWVTGAESGECVIALRPRRHGTTRRVAAVRRHPAPAARADGSYWTGWQFAAQVNWPDEHSTWTAAAVILAADALSRTTPGQRHLPRRGPAGGARLGAARVAARAQPAASRHRGRPLGRQGRRSTRRLPTCADLRKPSASARR